MSALTNRRAPVTYERVMKRRPGDAEDGEDDAPAESK